MDAFEALKDCIRIYSARSVHSGKELVALVGNGTLGSNLVPQTLLSDESPSATGSATNGVSTVENSSELDEAKLQFETLLSEVDADKLQALLSDTLGLATIESLRGIPVAVMMRMDSIPEKALQCLIDQNVMSVSISD